jgi:protease-4
VVALISGTGAIVQGRGRRGPFPGGAMGSDLVAAAFRSAVKDGHVKAIVFRVNSPGGSYIASDVIWREVGQARASGVPVVVSMADVAASGGYYVSMAADAIVAEPGTLTGSIGVLGGKAVTTGLMDRLGIGYDAVAEGRHARMLSPRAPFSEDEWRRLEEWLDRVYDDFVGKVAAGRKLDRERAHELARGRVWTGADAAERGLVDELGGLSRAVELARQQAELPPDAELRRWPPSTPLEFLSPPKSSEDKAAASARLAGWGLGWGSYADVAARLGLPPAGPLTMPPLRLS